jgi:hypothetical protein
MDEGNTMDELTAALADATRTEDAARDALRLAKSERAAVEVAIYTEKTGITPGDVVEYKHGDKTRRALVLSIGSGRFSGVSLCARAIRANGTMGSTLNLPHWHKVKRTGDRRDLATLEAQP